MVGAAADYFFTSHLTSAASALVLNAFPVARNVAGRQSADLARELIEDGWSLVIFPEGGRSPDGWGQPFKGGAAYLSIRTGAPVVPVFIEGTGSILGKGMKRPKPGKTTVTFGAPLWPEEDESTRHYNERIEQAVTVLGDETLSDWWSARQRAARRLQPGPDRPGAHRLATGLGPVRAPQPGPGRPAQPPEAPLAQARLTLRRRPMAGSYSVRSAERRVAWRCAGTRIGKGRTHRVRRGPMALGYGSAMALRLRQVVLVAPELGPALEEVRDGLGIEPCFHDPGVAEFGLENVLFPIGDQFLEIVAPVQDGTAAGRMLERRGGAGGYMVMVQCDDLDRRRSRLGDLGVRVDLAGRPGRHPRHPPAPQGHRRRHRVDGRGDTVGVVALGRADMAAARANRGGDVLRRRDHRRGRTSLDGGAVGGGARPPAGRRHDGGSRRRRHRLR